MDTPVHRAEAGSKSSHWFSRFDFGNPFYVLSAVFLLYGIYRVAVDPKFLETETRQVIFNFSALQCYQVLLAITAVILARWRIATDAALLVKLEGLLVVAPFILLSHAVFLGGSLGQLLCVIGAGLTVLRVGLLKSAVPNLNLPRPLLVAGVFILSLNAALPLLFRSGLNVNSEAWVNKHLILWVLVLPTLVALLNVFPRLKESGGSPLEGRWLPLVLYSFWVSGTAMHLVCINYVDQVNFRQQTTFEPHLIAPALCALAWTLLFRQHDFFPHVTLRGRHALLVIPALSPLPALWSQHALFFSALTVLNTLLYLTFYAKQSRVRLALQLGIASFALAIASIPLGPASALLSSVSRGQLIAGSLILFVVLEGTLLRTPKFAVLGGLLVGLSMLGLAAGENAPVHLALQVAVAWFLLHSVWWDDTAEPLAPMLRLAATLGWILHSWFCIQEGAGLTLIPWLALLVSLGYCAMRAIGVAPARVFVLLAAAMSIAPIPLQSPAAQMRELPSGLVALFSSFVLFALGTAFAMWRGGVLIPKLGGKGRTVVSGGNRS
jgi:hypothetical protein